VSAWQNKLNNRNQTHFGGTLLVAPKVATQELRLKVLDLSTAPDGFDRQDATSIDKSEIAAAFGMDLRDLAYSFGVAGQTRADAEVQDRKGRGKGVGEFLETFTERFNQVYLNGDLWEINFDYLDDEQDEQQALIRSTRSMARDRDLTSGVTTIRVERELMWERGEVSQEQFEDMELLDGRLPNGLDVMLLFQSQDRQFGDWLALSASDPTNIAENDSATMIEEIHDRILEVSEFINSATSSSLSRKARQALAALEKLQAMYQVAESMMLDEQAALEAADEGAEEMQPDEVSGEDIPPDETSSDASLEETKEKKSLHSKQIEGILSEYEDEFRRHVQMAIDGEIPQNRFDDAIAAIVAAALLSLFQRGGDFVYSELTPEALAAIQAEIDIHLNSLRSLSNDIYGGRYAPENLGVAGALTRLAVWLSIAAGIYYYGMAHRRDDPFLAWRISPLKDHCTDCVRLDGQVHRASEWRASGWRPRNISLECRGFNCGCVFELAQGPSTGGF